MNLFVEIYRVNRTEKLAAENGQGPVVADLWLLKHALWTQLKTAAARDPNGVAVGIARQILGHAADRLHTGEKLACTPDHLITAAASIGSAYAVDLAIEKMAASKELTPDEAQKMATLNVESVFFELGKLFKTAKSGCTHTSDGSYCAECKCPHGMKCDDCPACRVTKTGRDTSATKEAFLGSLLSAGGRMLGGVGRAVARPMMSSARQLGSATMAGVGGARGAMQAARAFGDPLGAAAGATARGAFSGFRNAGGLQAAGRLGSMGLAAGMGYRALRPQQPQGQPQGHPQMMGM